MKVHNMLLYWLIHSALLCITAGIIGDGWSCNYWLLYAMYFIYRIFQVILHVQYKYYRMHKGGGGREGVPLYWHFIAWGYSIPFLVFSGSVFMVRWFRRSSAVPNNAGKKKYWSWEVDFYKLTTFYWKWRYVVIVWYFDSTCIVQQSK